MNTRSAPRTSRRKSCTRATRGDAERTGMRGESMSSSFSRVRIAVDGRHLAAGRGVARYSRTLLDAMAARFGEDDWRIECRGWAANASAALVGRPRTGRGADV